MICLFRFWRHDTLFFEGPQAEVDALNEKGGGSDSFKKMDSLSQRLLADEGLKGEVLDLQQNLLKKRAERCHFPMAKFMEDWNVPKEFWGDLNQAQEDRSDLFHNSPSGTGVGEGDQPGAAAASGGGKQVGFLLSCRTRNGCLTSS